ncbi:hypothetical protein GobsT_12000 [Gemmata obscuriglobus]|uniref:Uncharacterized protein n=1 Tax=Gemmata obscuriglobus TaxID=114 RepID=A0A2Z3H3I5_9BACT|nr:hypothetical protein [Gemmata obscuriglobus]AWM40328.1 hypothetical protein C1280_27200 [Gemmata obscuriglobus]QEG26461.1 hypothetical protein GobsT_12000 [Gemmata obscuriglobus]VTS01671.1 unnamed protein product [Gemmata obscuriglobus UQM 2246]
MLDLAAVAGIGSLSKALADFIKLRRDRKSGEETKTLRDYIEACRRRDHAEALGRFDVVGEQLTGLERLIETLGHVTDDQAAVVLNAIEDGNFALLSQLRTADAALHARLDQIIHRLGVAPRQLFRDDCPSRHDAAIQAFEAKYLDRVRDDFGRLEMLGVPRAQDIRQKLDIAYVSLELSALAADGAGGGRADRGAAEPN